MSAINKGAETPTREEGSICHAINIKTGLDDPILEAFHL